MVSHNSTNQIGTLALDTLACVLCIDEEFVGTIEVKISPLIIALFLKNTSGKITK